MACCCKSCVLGIAALLLALYCGGCCNLSLIDVLKTLSSLPVIGPFLIENSFVLLPSTATLTSDAASTRLFTAEQLWECRGGDKGLYLAALGLVYDVSKAEKHYGPKNQYHGFVGRDACRAFVTGDFTDEKSLSEDVTDFIPEQFLKLNEWLERFPKDYPFVGKLIGRYYDENGEPTADLLKVKKGIETANANIQLIKDLSITFPGCNSRFILGEGGKFTCTKNSHGVERDFEGFPRKFTLPETGKVRCACVEERLLGDPRLEEYPNCPSDSHECSLDYVHHDEI